MEETISKYDRTYGGVLDIGLSTKPSTIKIVQSLTGQAAQRESLTKRRRSISSRASMKARMDAGEVIGFQRRAISK